MGDAASRRRAFIEAEKGYKQALANLRKLPESFGRDAIELELINALIQVLFAIKGYNAPETVSVSARACALAEKSGNLGQLVVQVFGTWASALVSGDCGAASALANRLLDLAQREGSNSSLGFAHQAQLTTRCYRGDLVGAEEHFERGRAFFEEPAFSKFLGARANTFSHASFNAWRMGRPNVALERMREALEGARESNTPYELAFAQYCSSFLSKDLREPKLTEAAAAETIALCEKHGFPLFAAMSHVTLGWARAQLGRTSEGVALIRQGLTGLAQIGAHLTLPLSLILLAETQVLDNQIAEALNSVEQALQANPDELTFRPESLRTRGELQLKQERAELAEADFREAVALAQRMSAKSLELRATTSLARLLRDTDRRDEARKMLGEIYGWFTEGFDTADLKDAKALLDELSP